MKETTADTSDKPSRKPNSVQNKVETLVVVSNPKDWQMSIPGVKVVTARSYITDFEFARMHKAKVFNLCRHYKYQSYGYYVSLLAEARGHKPIPTILTMQDLRSPSVVRVASDVLQDKIQKSLNSLASDKFELSIYFGQNVAKRHEMLSAVLFRYFPAPFMKAVFVKEDGEWGLQNITALPASAIPVEHRDFAYQSAVEFFTQKELRDSKPKPARFDLAILWDSTDPTKPSDKRAIEKFIKAAEDFDIEAEVINKEDYGRLLEFDALFIRVTTAVNHYSYRFSRKAAAEGLIVIDDPVSILRCTNKVYLAELFTRHEIPIPKSIILHKDNLEETVASLGFPLILKRPDSSSSLGVKKATTLNDFQTISTELFDTSDLLIAQEYLPTPFDWRIGILDRRPLYAIKYYMAKDHWQIIKRNFKTGRWTAGNTEPVPIEEVPPEGVKLALKAANLIGDGLYGVDLKQVGKKWYVIEVNDNPSMDTRIEDAFLKDELYRRVMGTFLRRIQDQKENRSYK